MKNVVRGLLFSALAMGLFAALTAAQNRPLDVEDAGPTGYAAYDVNTGKWHPSGPGGIGRMGNLIYDNHATAHTYWNMGYKNLHYIALDWGILYQPTTTQLSDEIIDGFEFRYSTNVKTTLIDMDVHFYDSCTGWGNIGTLEALFPFTGLPNASGVGPGANKNWVISVDLEGTGYEFILGRDIGWAHVYHNGMDPQGTLKTGPVIGKRPGAGGNGPTGTEDSFDTYYPNGVYDNSWYFGGSPWATWPIRLWGGSGFNSTYYGQGSQGNDAELYEAGSWYAGNTVRFMMRDHSGLLSYLLPSLSAQKVYIPSYDVTRLIGNVVGGITAWPLTKDPDGLFETVSVQLPKPLPQMPIYFQGGSFTIGSIPPIDLSNGIRMKK